MAIKKYDLILCDCPFEYDNAQQNDPTRGGITYPTMNMEELYNLPVHKIAKENSILVYWCTFPKICDLYYNKYDPLSVIRAWGFRPVTALFVWIKSNKKTVLDLSDELDTEQGMYSGLGRYTNSNAEFAIVARRGKMLERKAKNVKQLIVAPIGKHSAKPVEQYTRLENLFGNDLDKVELFGRKENPPPKHQNWDVVGLDWEPSIDIRDWLKQYE